MKTLAFLAVAVASWPAMALATAAVTCVYYERVWLPRIAGED